MQDTWENLLLFATSFSSKMFTILEHVRICFRHETSNKLIHSRIVDFVKNIYNML